MSKDTGITRRMPPNTENLTPPSEYYDMSTQPLARATPYLADRKDVLVAIVFCAACSLHLSFAESHGKTISAGTTTLETTKEGTGRSLAQVAPSHGENGPQT